MSEYTLYLVTALLVAVSVASSQLAFGPGDVDNTGSGMHIEQARYSVEPAANRK